MTPGVLKMEQECMALAEQIRRRRVLLSRHEARAEALRREINALVVRRERLKTTDPQDVVSHDGR
jgi:hypothetical protein